VAGEGKCRAELEKKIADLGLENEFVLLGSVPNPYPYLKECDLYVHASRYEGKSIAIQEAITLGNAVIASDRSGNREQIRDGIDGVLCELSPEGIASAVERVLKDDELMKKLKENALLIRYDSRDDVEKMLALVEQN
jgi:glycosyltransferase involved in cell wall biosynthesis